MAMKSGHNLQKGRLRRRWKFLLALALILAAVGVSFAYLNLTQQPAESLAIGPRDDPGAWSYALADGTALEPDGDGAFALPAEDTVVYGWRTLPENITSRAVLWVAGTNCDAAFFVDGVLTANPSNRFGQDGSFSAPAAEKGTSTGFVMLSGAEGRTLTMAVQFLGGTAKISALPQLSLYRSVGDYNSQALSAAASAALPAGVFLAAALLLLGLFLLRLWKERAEWGLLLLAGSALSLCLNRTVVYSLKASEFLQTPAVIWFTHQVLPTLFLLWTLWLHFSGRAKKFGWLPLLAATATCVGFLIPGLAGWLNTSWMNLLSTKVLPLVMLLYLLWGGREARRLRGWFRGFFALGGVLLALAAVVGAVSLLRGGDFGGTLTAAWSAARQGRFFSLMNLLDYLILLNCVLLAVYDLIRNLSRLEVERQALALQKRGAEESAEVLYRRLEEGRANRHEQRHHMETLYALCQEGDLERVQNYVEGLRGELDAVPVRYTDNVIVNSIVTPRLQKARENGVDVTAALQVPERLAIEDADLSVYLSNLLDNAVEAACAVEDPRRRVLTLKMGIHSQRLFIGCENSYDGALQLREDGLPATTKAGEGHGYGLGLMRRVAEKYNSILSIQHKNGMFSVKTNLWLGESGPEA